MSHKKRRAKFCANEIFYLSASSPFDTYLTWSTEKNKIKFEILIIQSDAETGPAEKEVTWVSLHFISSFTLGIYISI